MTSKVYQFLAHGWWFSPASSTTETGRHDIAEILLKVALNTKNQSINLRNSKLPNRVLCLRYILMHIPSFLVLNMFLQDICNFYRSLSLGMKYQYPTRPC
jgi:hypothetical protein